MASNHILGPYGGYRSLYSFGLINLIYLATEVFCNRNYPYQRDALGKYRGQMEGAARSARQNIVEGSSRAGTSPKTEYRLLDVAKGSLEELAGDYEHFIMAKRAKIWRYNSPDAMEVSNLKVEPFHVQDIRDIRREFNDYVDDMRTRFEKYLEAEDGVYAANALLIVIDRACALLRRQMDRLEESIIDPDDMDTRITRLRRENSERKATEQAARGEVPQCPECGKPMRLVTAKKGPHAGNRFWSCIGFPECRGTRSFTGK